MACTRSSIVLCFVVACGGRHGSSAADAGAQPSEACLRAREERAAAERLDRGGHELLARAKLDEANAACADERGRSGALEARVLAALGDCARARTVPSDAGDVESACRTATAPSKGTDATMRAKMREAFAASRTKDFARASALYLDAWAERHPNPVALEDAGRMAGLAGDAPRARRLRDRALFEAEASEHAVAVVTNRVRASAGAGRLVSGTLTVADGGKIVARDAGGELRVLLDADGRSPALSPLGTLATTTAPDGDATFVRVYDLLTGERLLEHDRSTFAVASPDDTRLFVRGTSGDRIVDAATGDVRAKLDAPGFAKLDVIGFASNGDLVVRDSSTDTATFRDWDVRKDAFGSLASPSSRGVGFVSSTGRYFVSLGIGDFDAMPLMVRDLETRKVVAQWSGRFGSVDAFDLTPDASVLATGSYNSVRLWTVAQRKQGFVANRTRRGDNFDDDLGQFAFSDDGKTVILGRDARTMLWDVATGTERETVSNQRDEDVLRALPFGDGGVIFVLDDAVRVVPAGGDAHVLCRGYHQRFYPDVGPTNAVLSPSGKSLACSMSGGAVHVFDTATWKEQASIRGPDAAPLTNTGMVYVWDGVPPTVRPVDLAFSADDATLTVVSDGAVHAYDARTGKELSSRALHDPTLALVRRHARFADGSVLAKTADGNGALFDASGARRRTVKLVPGARLDAPDAFSADGKAYAVVVGDVLHTVALDTGDDRATKLQAPATAIALSGDGRTAAVVGKDGSAYRVSATTKKIEDGGAKRAFFLGGALVVVTGKGDTLDLFAGDDPPRTLEIDPNGLVARGPGGAFEVRGRPEAECVVGRVFLTEETCADRAAPGLVAAWLRAR